MNINFTIRCETCGEPTNIRLGISNRKEQPIQFSCQTCHASIEIILGKKGTELKGAKEVRPPLPFDGATNFVDLHLDFPVSFDKYVMGNTPFMQAYERVSFEDMGIHGARLRTLDETADDRPAAALIIKLYLNEKWTPFKTNIERRFKIRIGSDKLEDRNAALYTMLSQVMAPFAFPGQDSEAIELYNKTLLKLRAHHWEATQAFMKEVMDKSFLKNIQKDCLEIYPKIMDAEIPLRPALFLDFDEEWKNNPIAMRVSHATFDMYKDVYKDISEILSRLLILMAGVNNLLKRGDHNAFKPEIGKAKSGKDFTPKSLQVFADVPFGNKLDYIDDSWYELLDGSANNKLRNAIAHYKTDYNAATQTVTYFPRKEGMEEEKGETISFLLFMRYLLTSYREMNRLHHLVKCLFYLQFIIIDKPRKAT